MGKLNWKSGFSWKDVSTQAGFFSVYQGFDGNITTTRDGINIKGHENVTTIDEGCALCEAHFESVVDYLATSNGYVRLQPGQVVDEHPRETD